MDNDEFNKLARELGERFKGTKTAWVVVVAPPGSFTGERGPHSGGNVSVEAQIGLLRSIADSLERETATEVVRVKL